MPPPLLLVHDDLATIASVRRALTRAGHLLHLATSTADALSAFEHLSPSAILLAPAVEGGRGASFLAEVRARPAGASTPGGLLGEALPGAALPLVPLPVDAPTLLQAVEDALSGETPDGDDVPLLDAGQMEELPPLVDAALAEAEADLEAEAFARLRAPAGPARSEAAHRPREDEEVAAAEALTHAAWEEADLSRARAEAAESARAEAEAARAEAEAALRAYQKAEAAERGRRTEAEARAQAEAEEARRLEAEARAAQAHLEEARARAEEAEGAVRAAQAQGTAEAELLASALREEEVRRTSELAVQEHLRAEAEARAEREAQARAAGEARAAAEVARLAEELRARAQAAERAQAAAEARSAEQLERLTREVQERDAAAQRARAEAEDWAARERQALFQAERAQAQAQALEVEAAQLAERLAHGERAALEALARAEEALRRERAAGEALRHQLAAARATPLALPQPLPPAPPARAPRLEDVAARRGPVPATPEAAASTASARTAAARLEWGAADGGRVSLEQLAALVLRLAEVRATAQLELRAEETLRILWLSEGRLLAAASTHPAESLVEVALADGLLDASAAAEARALRLPDEALAAELVERGVLREGEVLPLLQRCTEARALEALSEQDSAYRLAADGAPPNGGCASDRPLEAVLAEALHRALSPEEVLARTHGPHATPRRLRWRDPSPFEFQERERRLLEAVDAERTVAELLSRSGIRQELGLRALAVAQVLGLLEVTVPPQPAAAAVDPGVELERLQQKWTAAEEADYFSVLGLPRTAGTEEVQRAHARLAAEFHPLRYAAHPDPEVPARAARLATLLDEAAAALGDERLRVAYARSLVDAEGGSRA